MAGPFGTLLPFDPAALAAQERPDLTPQQQSLTNYDPTLRDRLAAAVLGSQPSPLAIDMTKRLLGSAGAGNSGFSAIDLTPAGAVMGAQESLREGDPQGAALAIMPIPGARGAGAYSREIRPAGENLRDLIDANFNHAKVVGDKMVPIGWLKGGVGQAADDAERVTKLKDKIAAPDGYIERLVVDDAGNVIEGQHRLDALRSMGEKAVPVTVIGDLTRGHDYDAARAALKDSGLHPDQQHQLLGRVFEALDKEKGKIAGAREYDVPGFNKPYNAVLDALEAKTEKLPMDDASRITRAKALGYDTENTMYHGSPTLKEGQNFDLNHPTRTDTGYLGSGVYMTPQKWVADVYATTQRGGPKGETVDLFAKKGNFKDILYDENYRQNINDFAKSIGVKTEFAEGRHPEAQKFAKEFREAMQKAGYDGARGINTDGTVAEQVVYDPARIRSTKAAFDPKKDGKNEIMGAAAGFGALMPLLSGREEQ